MLILICTGVGFVILIAICVALIIIKFRKRDHAPPSATMLLDTDYRKSMNDPMTCMVDDSGHYRSLIKVKDKVDFPEPHQSQTLPRQGHFEPGPSVPYNPYMDAAQGRQFSTMQHDRVGQDKTNQWIPAAGASGTQRSGHSGAPDYFVLDKNLC